ncbi:MAG: Gfo/Idh/MocA family protein, partial [Calditrichia bacterium]
MSKEKVNLGVLGVGHLGSLHVKQLLQVPEANFVGIFDTNKTRLAEISRQYGVRSFPSYAAMLEEAQAVSIVTPTKYHLEHAREALLADRHVFIEKPIARSLQEADELIRLCRGKNLKIQVGHIERFNPAIIALEPLKINPLFIESHRMSNFDVRGTDVAVVLDLMIHDIDLILSFVKSPVAEIHASGASVISSSEDIANCRIQFENGCVANITASRISAGKMRKMRFFQPNAYISIDFLEGASEVYYIEEDGLRLPDAGLAFSLGQIGEGKEKKSIRYARLSKEDINPLRYELQLFCKAILEDRSPPITAEDGYRAL